MTTEWRKEWKLDDPEWVKKRKKQWLEIKKSPVFEYRFSKQEMTQIKNYFMTGSGYIEEPDESEWRYLSYHPDFKPFKAPCRLLLRCWLHPVCDINFWQYLKENSQDVEFRSSVKFFREQLKKNYPSKGSLFNGLDRELYHFFVSNRCRREDYSESSDEKYNKLAKGTLFTFRNIIDKYFAEDNPDSIVNDVFLGWSDAVTPAFLNFDDYNLEIETSKLSLTLDCVKRILNSPENYSTGQLEFANKFVKTFKEMDLPSCMAPIQILLDEL